MPKKTAEEKLFEWLVRKNDVCRDYDCRKCDRCLAVPRDVWNYVLKNFEPKKRKK